MHTFTRFLETLLADMRLVRNVSCLRLDNDQAGLRTCTFASSPCTLCSVKSNQIKLSFTPNEAPSYAVKSDTTLREISDEIGEDSTRMTAAQDRKGKDVGISYRTGAFG